MDGQECPSYLKPEAGDFVVGPTAEPGAWVSLDFSQMVSPEPVAQPVSPEAHAIMGRARGWFKEERRVVASWR